MHIKTKSALSGDFFQLAKTEFSKQRNHFPDFVERVSRARSMVGWP